MTGAPSSGSEVQASSLREKARPQPVTRILTRDRRYVLPFYPRSRRKLSVPHAARDQAANQKIHFAIFNSRKNIERSAAKLVDRAKRWSAGATCPKGW